MKDRASLTAEYMALFRAIESARPRVRGCFAIHSRPCSSTAGGSGSTGLPGVTQDAAWWSGFWIGGSPGARAAGIARTKWIDDEAARALETSTQLVLLGAGFDTRAYRCQPHSG